MKVPISEILRGKPAVVHSIAPSATVQEAVALMNDRKIGSVVVLDGERLAGIFTERDVLARVVGAGRAPTDTLVSEVMSTTPVTITAADTIDDVMAVMAERRVRHLPVVAEGRVVALLSIGDVNKWLLRLHQSEVETLRKYLSGAYPA